MSVRDIIGARTAKDLLGTMGPGLVGGSLFYFVLFLSFADFSILPIIGSLAFIISVVLAAITPAIMFNMIVTPKAIVKPAAERSFNYYVNRSGLDNEIIQKNFRKILFDEFEKAIEIELKQYRLIDKNSDNLKNTSSKSLQFKQVKNSIITKEIKFENYISLVIIFVIGLIGSLIGYFTNWLPLKGIIDLSDTLLANTNTIYVSFGSFSIIIIAIMIFAIMREKRDLIDYNRIMFDETILEGMKLSHDISIEIEDMKHYIESSFNSNIDDLGKNLMQSKENELDEAKYIESAQAIIMQRVISSLLEDRERFTGDNDSDFNSLIGQISHEYPLVSDHSIIEY